MQLQFSLFYELFRFVGHQNLRHGLEFYVENEIVEMITSRIIDQIFYKDWNIQQSAEPVLLLIMNFEHFPILAFVANKPYVNILPQLYKISKIATEFLIVCYTELAYGIPETARAILNQDNVKFVFSYCENFIKSQEHLEERPESKSQKPATLNFQKDKEMIFILELFRFLNTVVKELSADMSREFFYRYKQEISRLPSLVYFLSKNETIYELLLFIGGFFASVSHYAKESEMDEIYETILKNDNFLTFLSQQKQHLSEEKKQLIVYIGGCLDQFMAKQQDVFERQSERSEKTLRKGSY